MSLNGGKVIKVLSQDHKPGESLETKRIIAAGGKVYQ